MVEKISDTPREPIGIGNEKRVFMHDVDPKRVVAEYREKLTNEEIKGVYYFTKLIHLLFPDNYPDIFKAGNTKIAHTATFEAQNIDRDEILTKLSLHAVQDEAYLMGADTISNFSDETHSDIEHLENIRTTDERVQALIYDLRTLGIPVDSHNAGNFSIRPNDTVVYLDIQQPFVIDDGEVKLRFNTNAMYHAVAALPEDSQKQAGAYLSRLMELYEDLKKRTEHIHPLQ